MRPMQVICIIWKFPYAGMKGLIILTPAGEAKVYPIKKKKMYKNIVRRSDNFAGVRAAGFNQAAHKYNCKVKLGCLIVHYECLDKKKTGCFIVALLVGISACQKTNLYKQIRMGKKIDDLINILEITNVCDKAGVHRGKGFERDCLRFYENFLCPEGLDLVVFLSKYDSIVYN